MKNQGLLIRLGYARTGLISAIKREASLRFQMIIAVSVLLVLGILGAKPLWWAIVSLCIGIVLTAEMFNTALEQLIDHIHPERHPAIGLAKDFAAGAVLISSMVSVVIFIFFLVDRLGYFLNGILPK